MAVRAPNPDTTDETITITNTVYLKPLGIDVPTGCTCTVTFRGSRERFEVEIERHDSRWLLEGSGHVAELTGAFHEGEPDLPARVPNWIAEVMAEKIDVKEVSVYR